MKASNLIASNAFNELPVMPPYDFHSEILIRVKERLAAMCQKHSQAFIMSMAVLYPAITCLELTCDDEGQMDIAPPDNKLFSRWLADFIRYLKPYDPAYAWAREEAPDAPGRYHFHLALFMNGNLIQDPWPLLSKAQCYWARTLGLDDASGLIHLCQPQNDLSFHNNCFKLVRGSPDFQLKFNEAFCYLSYLAKTDSKSPIDGVRTFGCSTLN